MSSDSITSNPVILEEIADAVADRLSLTKLVYHTSTNALNITINALATQVILTTPVTITNPGGVMLCNLQFSLQQSVAGALTIDTEFEFDTVTTTYKMVGAGGFQSQGGTFSAVSDVAGGTSQTFTLRIKNNDVGALLKFLTNQTYFTLVISEIL